jgi:hypothetical protein
MIQSMMRATKARKETGFSYSSFSINFSNDVKREYCQKLSDLGLIVCPFGIEERKLIVNIDKFQKCLPNITNLDILDDLYYNRSRTEENRRKNLKSFDSYKKYEEGFVINRALVTLTSGSVIVLGKVYLFHYIMLSKKQ